MNDIDCDLCGSAARSFLKEENGYPISRCNDCSLLYVNRIPAAENGKVIGEYYSGTEAEIEANRVRYVDVSKFLLNEIDALHPVRGRLLDIGCGYGFFLAAAEQDGWSVSGTDLSEIAVEYVRSRHGIADVHVTDLSGDELTDERFDVINMTNVLEHVPSPTEVLGACVRRLEPGGLLVVRVPNMDYSIVQERLAKVIEILRLGPGYKLSLLATEPPSHLSGFNSRTLRRYFDKVGLETIVIKPSKLSATAQQSRIYQVFESMVGLLYKASFGKVNLAPTVIAVATAK